MTSSSEACSDAMNFLYGRLNYERSGLPRGSHGLGLGRMRRLMRRLGDPQKQLQIIHIAGTKGKGSTSTMIAAGLSRAGHCTGLFCSPHLHRLQERYLIDGQEITESELLALLAEIRPIVERMDDGQPEHARLTFFEITTALGLLYFARKACKTVVLEVGMGGRLDSTNIVRPIVSVITSISLDHTRQLGATTALIAQEKAGIIKRGTPVISGVTDEPARNVIRHVAQTRGVTLRQVQADYTLAVEQPGPAITMPTGCRVRVQTWHRQWPWLEVPLLGEHQAENAALALAVFDQISENGLNVGPADVQAAWAGLTMPARVEILGKRPPVVIDGAHNAASAQALASTIVHNFPQYTGRRVLVFGTTREKDLPGQLQALLPCFDEVVVTRYHKNPRALPLDETCQAIEQLNRQPLAVDDDPVSALARATATAGPQGLVVVTGSLFLAAELREHLLNPTPEKV